MKKIIGTTCMLFLGTLLVLGQSINITNPATGASWCPGQSYTINWISRGAVGATVRILLLQGTVVVERIALSTANNGSWRWTVPASTPRGSYTLHLRSLDNTAIEARSAFTIAPCGTPPPATAAIVVTSPDGAAPWYAGSNYTVRWTPTGALNASARVQLFQGASSVLNIAASAATAGGSCPWNIPSTQAPGTYFIRVSSADNRVHGDSRPFAIARRTTTPPPPPRGAMVITAPRAGEPLCIGQSAAINWTRTGTLAATVHVSLFADGSAYGITIGRGLPNNGTFNWPIPANAVPGNYSITVQTDDNQVSAPSPVFSIRACAAPARPSADAAIYVIQATSYNNYLGSYTAYIGEAIVIAWLRRGTMQDRVSITLMQGAAPMATIAESVWNINPYGNDLYKNSFEWIIPDSVQPGQYTIQVRTIDTLVSGTSDRFAIAGRLNNVSTRDDGMTVTSPRLAETWCLGQEHTITWNRESRVQANVNISLLTSYDTQVMAIARNVPNSGSFRFTPPLNLQRGAHRIIIHSVDNRAPGYARSQNFFLTRCDWEGPPTIRLIEPVVTTPGRPNVWCVGRTYTIRWETTGYPGNVRIILVHFVAETGRGREYVLSEAMPYSGSFRYRVPTSFSSPPDQPYTCNLYVELVNDRTIMDGFNVNIHTCGIERNFLDNTFPNQQEGWLSLQPADPEVCPTCVLFDLAALKKLLRNAPEPYSLALQKNHKTLVEFGNLGPDNQLPDRLSREFSPEIARLLLQGGKGFELVFKNPKGLVVFRKEIKLASEKPISLPPPPSFLNSLPDAFPLPYLADYNPECETCVRLDLRGIGKLLAPAEEPVQVDLFDRSQRLETLGIFGKQGKAGDAIDVKLSSDEFKHLTSGGPGYELVLKNSDGKIIRRLKANLLRGKSL